MELRIYSKSFEFKGLIDDFKSLQFERSFQGFGRFNLFLKPTHSTPIEKGDMLILKSNKVGIITDIKSTEASLNILGYELKGLLAKRILVMPDSSKELTGRAMDICETLIAENMLTSEDVDRNIPNLVVQVEGSASEDISFIASRGKRLHETVEKVLAGSNEGVEGSINIGAKTLKLTFKEGVNRSADQSLNNPVIFSRDFDNLYESIYYTSDSEHKNVAYVAGQGEGIDRVIREIGDSSGLDRRELFVDARDISTAEALDKRGIAKLKDFCITETFEGQILDEPFKYEKHYDLGDTVTLQDKRLGLRIHTMVTSVLEIYEGSYRALKVTFGSRIPTLVDKIKKVIE